MAALKASDWTLAPKLLNLSHLHLQLMVLKVTVFPSFPRKWAADTDNDNVKSEGFHCAVQ